MTQGFAGRRYGTQKASADRPWCQEIALHLNGTRVTPSLNPALLLSPTCSFMRHWLCSVVVLVGALSLPMVASSTEAASAPVLTEGQRARIERGEVITSVESDGGENRAELIALIEGDAASVWSVITDFESYEAWVPDQANSEVVQRSGNVWVLEGETRVPILPNRRYRLRDVRSERVVNGQTVYIDEWEYIENSGNMEENRGFWYVAPYDETRTLIRMVVFADLGMPVPQSVINWGTRRALPGLAEGIQQQTTERFE